MHAKRYIKYFDSQFKEQFEDVCLVLVNEYVEDDELTGDFSANITHQGDLAYLDFFNNGILLERIGLLTLNDSYAPNIEALSVINRAAEMMFREDTIYGVKDPRKLDAILKSIMADFFGQAVYPGVLNKAAALWFKIADAQCFHNGNKRTALLTCLYMLSLNGFVLVEVSGNEMYETSVKIANKELTQKDVYKFIRDHARLKCYDSREKAKALEAGFAIRVHVDKPSD